MEAKDYLLKGTVDPPQIMSAPSLWPPQDFLQLSSVVLFKDCLGPLNIILYTTSQVVSALHIKYMKVWSGCQ